MNEDTFRFYCHNAHNWQLDDVSVFAAVKVLESVVLPEFERLIANTYD